MPSKRPSSDLRNNYTLNLSCINYLMRNGCNEKQKTKPFKKENAAVKGAIVYV